MVCLRFSAHPLDEGGEKLFGFLVRHSIVDKIQGIEQFRGQCVGPLAYVLDFGRVYGARMDLVSSVGLSHQRDVSSVVEFRVAMVCLSRGSGLLLKEVVHFTVTGEYPAVGSS